MKLWNKLNSSNISGIKAVSTKLFINFTTPRFLAVQQVSGFITEEVLHKKYITGL